MDSLALQLQQVLGGAYEVTGLLGRGGMGVVYRATDRRLRREVAIKVLPPALGYSAELRERFVREARIAAGLSHPNIVSIHDVGESGDLVWFVMTLVDGESLRARVERVGPLPIGMVRRVLVEVAQALGYAHARGVVHRDIKPDNILLERAGGRAMVTDFGIARANEDALTETGQVVGTAQYMAPEQALAATVDARADQFALGLVGWYMLTGRNAVEERTLPAVIMRHMRKERLDIGRLPRPIPTALASALRRCLAPDAAERFERIEQLTEALEQMGGNLPETPAPVRSFLRATEQVFGVTSLFAIGLGVAGTANIPPVFYWMVGFSLGGAWTQAIEAAVRQGVTWPTIRRAISLERARRFEELERRRLLGAASAVLFVTMGVAFMIFGVGTPPKRPQNPLLDSLLLLGGALGVAFAARTFGLRRNQAASASDWRFPPWLDRLGALLFARVTRRGWRLALEQDADGLAAVGPTEATFERAIKRIRAALGKLGDSSQSPPEILAVAEDLALEGKVVAQQLAPLLARLARLNEGVMVSRTIGLAAAAESDVDRLEAQADVLRQRGSELAGLLEALALSLERHDTAGLAPLLSRAQALSSEIRRVALAEAEARQLTT